MSEKGNKKKVGWKPDENITMIIKKSDAWKPDKKLTMDFKASHDKKRKKE